MDYSIITDNTTGMTHLKMFDEFAVENPLDAKIHFSATVFDLILQYITC
jgi:hypothetical protein